MNAHRSNVALLRDALACASVLLAAVIAGCSGSDNSGEGTSCTAGSTVTCSCADGSSGSQLCGAAACTCGGHDSGSAVDAGGGGIDSSVGAEDAEADTGNGNGNGDGGHLHDSSAPDTSGATGYGATCQVDKDCTDNVYNTCFIGQQKSICSKSCTTNADCPAPPTSGTCNKQKLCK